MSTEEHTHSADHGPNTENGKNKNYDMDTAMAAQCLVAMSSRLNDHTYFASPEKKKSTSTYVGEQQIQHDVTCHNGDEKERQFDVKTDKNQAIKVLAKNVINVNNSQNSDENPIQNLTILPVSTQKKDGMCEETNKLIKIVTLTPKDSTIQSVYPVGEKDSSADIVARILTDLKSLKQTKV